MLRRNEKMHLLTQRRKYNLIKEKNWCNNDAGAIPKTKEKVGQYTGQNTAWVKRWNIGSRAMNYPLQKPV